jgi:hypothetical protein
LQQRDNSHQERARPKPIHPQHACENNSSQDKAAEAANIVGKAAAASNAATW